MIVENIKTESLKAYAKNAKYHPDDQVERIANSIKQFGFQQPIVIDRNNVIVIGHGRLLAAKKLGLAEVPCIRADELTDEQIKALRLVDNRVAKSKTDNAMLAEELNSIVEINMESFGFDLDIDFDIDLNAEAELSASLQHNVFENQERKQFPSNNYYGFPEMCATQTVGSKFIRFSDWHECKNPKDYIAHFYYSDFAFMAAWRQPDKYIDKLRRFKAVVSPDFSLYTDFPIALQILSCYRRQWCGAYWQSLGIDVIPDVVWGEKESFKFCFDGIPKYSTVAVSTVGVKNDKTWNNKTGSLFKDGYAEMMDRLAPTTVLFYGDMINGLEGNIIRIPSYYAERREMLNEKKKRKLQVID